MAGIYNEPKILSMQKHLQPVLYCIAFPSAQPQNHSCILTHSKMLPEAQEKTRHTSLD